MPWELRIYTEKVFNKCLADEEIPTAGNLFRFEEGRTNSTHHQTNMQQVFNSLHSRDIVAFYSAKLGFVICVCSAKQLRRQGLHLAFKWGIVSLQICIALS